MDFSFELLKDLTNANGTSGHEDAATEVMATYLKDVVDEIKYDRLGSLISIKKGTSDSPRILIDAHLDEVGFMVKEITDEGFIKFLPLGGWWGPVALGQRMRIMTRKGSVLGVIGTKPPHLLKDEERKKAMNFADMFIDVGGMEKYDVRKNLGVRVGDAIVPDSEFTVMGNKQVYMAKAFDNRVACALVVDTMRKLQRIRHPNTVYGAGSVLEEVGSRGAATVAHVTDPDVAICLDVGLALDIPGNKDRSEKLGAGAAILIYDRGLVPSTRLRELIMATAEEKKIPYHLGYMEGGSGDGARIHITRAGVPSIYMGPPVRYIHSHNSLLYRKDYDNTLKLVVEVVKKLNKKTVDSLTAR